MGIRWSKFSLQGEEETASQLAPFIFPEIMSGPDSFLTRDTRRGAVASFYVYINFSAESRTWTCAYRTVSSYLKCLSITSGPSIDILRAEESHRRCLLDSALIASVPHPSTFARAGGTMRATSNRALAASSAVNPSGYAARDGLGRSP
jgi:hypothetical protein